jgi:hypothetical protein
MVEYLGLVILLCTIAMDLVKVAGVANWPVPKTKKEVQSFLGFTNFLSQVHERVFPLSPIPFQPHKEGCHVELGHQAASCI